MSSGASSGAATGRAGLPVWTLDSAQRAAIHRGEVVVAAARDDAGAGRATNSIRAAIHIAASPDHVFDVMTDCGAAPNWVPHMISCEVLDADPTGRWELIAHRVDYGWYVPRVSYVFRAHYADRREIRFEHVSGDFDENEGLWSLQADAGGAHTIVTYRVRSRPKIRIPDWLYQRGVQAEIPALLRALRQRALR